MQQILGIPQGYASDRQMAALTDRQHPIRSLGEMRALVATATANIRPVKKANTAPVQGSTSPAIRASKERANASRAEYLRLLNSQAEGEAFRAQTGKR